MHTARPTTNATRSTSSTRSTRFSTRLPGRLLARLVRRPAPERPGVPGQRRPRPLVRSVPLPAAAAAHAAHADLAAMGAAIATAGPSASHALLAHVADHARARGVASSAVGLLDDPTVPDVVRTRAFSVVATRLGEASPAAVGRRSAA
jgi:hypothetical protein